MTLKKLLLIIAGGVAILGSFLPWAAITFFVSIRMNAFQMADPLPIILAILALFCGIAIVLLNVLSEKQIKNLIKVKDTSKLSLYFGVALVAIAIIAFIYVKVNSSGVANASWGVWLIGLAGIATTVLPLLKNVKQLDNVVLGQPEKSEKKTEKTEKKSTKK